ncbi:MAG: hypothetical protein ACE5KV_03195 [Thermoplasmata archaeon]
MAEIDEKYKLARILKNPIADIRKAIPVVAKAWIPHRVHVESFFNVLRDCLDMSKSLGIASVQLLNNKLSELAELPRDRDNLPALMAMATELLSIVEGDLESVESRIRNLEDENKKLKSELSSKNEKIKTLEDKLSAIEKIR